MPVKTPLAFKVTERGCFEVTSHRPGSDGYPLLRIAGTVTRAHRHIWKQCFGPIPPSICVCHHCDNRVCVNPEHLFLGTRADNSRDMVLKGRVSSRLTPADVRKIRHLYIPGDRINGGVALSKRFGVSHTTVSHIVRWGTWKYGMGKRRGE